MQFRVMNRRDAKRYTFSPNCVFDCIIVSITDVGSIPNTFNYTNPHIKGVCALQFDDVDFGEPYCITREDAEKILEFVSQRIDKVDLVIVHCEAGVSRSAGVCAALMKIFTGDDWEIFNKPRYCPNMSCYRSVLEAAFGSYDEKDANEKLRYNIAVWREANGLD